MLTRVQWLITTTPLLGVLLGCGERPGPHEQAARVEDPCTAMESAVPQSVADHDAYRQALRERCVSTRCAAYQDAVRAGDAAAIDAVLGPLVRLAARADGQPDPARLPESCRSAVLLDRARLGYARARGAADSRPPRWDEALAALEGVPELPGELVPFAGDASIVDRVHLGCYRDGSVHVRRAVEAADWGSVSTLAGTTLRCALRLPPDQSPPEAELTALRGLVRRARACDLVTQARDAEIPDDVSGHIDAALTEFDELPAGDVRLTAAERSALAAARAAARREADRCDRQVALNDRCQERCAHVGEYRSADWMERCIEYCDQRAPLCADQRDRWVSAGRPASGVPVPVPRLCTPSTRAVAAGGGAAERTQEPRRPRRNSGEVSSRDFE